MPGLFVAATLVDHARAAEATEVTMATIRSLADAPVTDEDLVSRKATVTGAFYRGIETIDGIAGALAELVLYEVPLAELAAFVPEVEAVDAAMVRDFAARGLIPDDFVVLVGDASKFVDALGDAYGETTVIPADALDLGSPTLTSG
jgi:zinc protease